MDELISRKAAIEAIDVLCQEHRYRIPGKAETYSKYNEAWQDALDRAEGAIGNLPPAEPKRGKWERHYSRPNVYADLFWHCSECGYRSSDNWADKFNFCPNCGADMREVTP